MMNQAAYSAEQIASRLEPLFNPGRTISAEARRRIVELGAAGTDRLVAVVGNQDLWDETAPGSGWAPILAAELLGEIGDATAIGPLFDVLGQVDPNAVLDEAITDAICQFGADAIGPGRALLDGWDDPFLEVLAYVFARLPVRRDEVLQVLLKFFLAQPVPGSARLAEYGDPTAIDALEVALKRYIAAADGQVEHRRPIFAIAEAIEGLGGHLTDAQRRVVDDLKARRTRSQEVVDKLADKPSADDSQTYRNTRDLGRNDPCWCGSHKKYKHCHWVADQR